MSQAYRNGIPSQNKQKAPQSLAHKSISKQASQTEINKSRKSMQRSLTESHLQLLDPDMEDEVIESRMIVNPYSYQSLHDSSESHGQHPWHSNFLPASLMN